MASRHLADFLATDNVPETLFGFPVVHTRDQYTDRDLAFFEKYPEAAGFYDIGDDEETAQAAKGGNAKAPEYGLRENGAKKERGRHRLPGDRAPAEHDPTGRGFVPDRKTAPDRAAQQTPGRAGGRPNGRRNLHAGYPSPDEGMKRSPRTARAKGVAPAAGAPAKGPESAGQSPYTKEAPHPWGFRLDGTPKGRGWLGEITLPDGKVETEFSLGIDFGKGEMEIPMLVPTLTKEEVDLMASRIMPNLEAVPENIVEKAVAHARHMINRGGSVWADSQPTEEQARFNRLNGAIKEAIPFIKERESFREDAYEDKVKKGLWTIGYGQTTILDPETKKMRSVVKGDKIKEEDAAAFVEKRVRENAIKLRHDHPEWEDWLSIGALAALYDIAYNGGTGLLSEEESPNLNKALKDAKKDHDAIVWREVPTYKFVDGKVIKGLENRRNDAVKRWKE